MKMHRISQEGPEATGKILYVQFFLVLSLPICYTVFKAYLSYVPAEKAVCIFLISFQKIYAFPNHHYEKQEIFLSPAKRRTNEIPVPYFIVFYNGSGGTHSE